MKNGPKTMTINGNNNNIKQQEQQAAAAAVAAAATATAPATRIINEQQETGKHIRLGAVHKIL